MAKGLIFSRTKSTHGVRIQRNGVENKVSDNFGKYGHGVEDDESETEFTDVY